MIRPITHHEKNIFHVPRNQRPDVAEWLRDRRHHWRDVPSVSLLDKSLASIMYGLVYEAVELEKDTDAVEFKLRFCNL